MAKNTENDESQAVIARLAALEEALIAGGALPKNYKYEPPKPEVVAKAEVPAKWRGNPDAPVPPLMSDEKLERMLAEQEEKRRQEEAAKAEAAKNRKDDGVIGLAPDNDETPNITRPTLKAPQTSKAPQDVVAERFSKKLAPAAAKINVTLTLTPVIENNKTIAYDISSTETKLSRRNILPIMGLNIGEALDESKVKVLSEGKTLRVDANLLETAASRPLVSAAKGQ